MTDYAFCFLFIYCFFLTEIQLIYNVVLVSYVKWFSIAEKWNMVANRVSLYNSEEFRSCLYYLNRETCPECQFIIHAASVFSTVKWDMATVQINLLWALNKIIYMKSSCKPLFFNVGTNYKYVIKHKALKLYVYG